MKSMKELAKEAYELAEYRLPKIWAEDEEEYPPSVTVAEAFYLEEQVNAFKDAFDKFARNSDLYISGGRWERPGWYEVEFCRRSWWQ